MLFVEMKWKPSRVGASFILISKLLLLLKIDDLKKSNKYTIAYNQGTSDSRANYQTEKQKSPAR